MNGVCTYLARIRATVMCLSLYATLYHLRLLHTFSALRVAVFFSILLCVRVASQYVQPGIHVINLHTIYEKLAKRKEKKANYSNQNGESKRNMNAIEKNTEKCNSPIADVQCRVKHFFAAAACLQRVSCAHERITGCVIEAKKETAATNYRRRVVQIHSVPYFFTSAGRGKERGRECNQERERESERFRASVARIRHHLQCNIVVDSRPHQFQQFQPNRKIEVTTGTRKTHCRQRRRREYHNGTDRNKKKTYLPQSSFRTI